MGAVRRSRKQKAKANRTPIPQLPLLDCHPHLLIFSSTRRLPSGDGRRPAHRRPPLPSSSFTSLPPERPPAKPRGRKDCGGGVSGFVLLTAKGPGGGRGAAWRWETEDRSASAGRTKRGDSRWLGRALGQRRLVGVAAAAATSVDAVGGVDGCG